MNFVPVHKNSENHTFTDAKTHRELVHSCQSAIYLYLFPLLLVTQLSFLVVTQKGHRAKTSQLQANTHSSGRQFIRLL